VPRSALFVAALLVLAVGLGAFFAGRGTAHGGDGYRAGYVAGREDAFGNFDGGWGYGEPYIVVLRRGSPKITYAVARRLPMRPGVEYRACGHTVCSRPAP
jgi:hypothetical protein